VFKKKFQFLLFNSNCLEKINQIRSLNFTPFKFSGWLKDLLAFMHYFSFRNMKEEIRNYIIVIDV
jgi:hypothetical protein